MENTRQRELEKEQFSKEIRAPDLEFKPNPVHLTIMKEAKRNSGLYDKRKAIQRIRNSNNPEKLKNQMILWNEVNLNTLINAGYLVKKDDNTYMANPLAYDIQKSKFRPGKNHMQLLLKNKDGIIKTLDLKRDLGNKMPAELQRQKKIIDGMIKRLNENGYIECIGKGEYKITETGFGLLNNTEANRPLPSTRDSKVSCNRKAFAVTKFDRCLNDVIHDGKVDELLLKEHEKSGTITKRINTFKKQGLITQRGELTKECITLLENVLERSKDKMLTIDQLSPQQLQLLKDVRIFLNLSKEQIVKYIYKDQVQIADLDLQFLLKKRVLKKDDDMGIYIMDKIGIELSNDLFPDAVKYYTKLYSRKAEVEHDMLVYTAYQRWSAQNIFEKGYEIIDLKNDRQLRRDDAKKYGHMIGAYPDLRVFYKIPSSNKILTHDIEVDCGYDSKTIKSKIQGLLGSQKSNLGWYCKTFYQAVKVANILTKDTTKVSRMNVARKMTIYYMDKEGNLQTVQHKHWDK